MYIPLIPNQVKAPTEYPEYSYIQNNSIIGSSSVLGNPILEELWVKAEEFELDYDELVYLANCESGLNPEKVNWNDNGSPSYYLFQWKIASWNYYNELFGTELDINNWKEQIEMTLKVVKTYGYGDWKNCHNQLLLSL